MSTSIAVTPPASSNDAGDSVEQLEHDHPGFMWRLLQGLAGMASRLGFRMQVRGVENIPAHGGVLIISNHQSFADPVLLAIHAKRPFAYMAGSWLFKFKPLAWVISSLNAFPVTQGKGDIGAIKETIRVLNDGWVLTIFPEGKRTFDGKMDAVLPGAALVVRRAKVPVVPAIIVGAFEAFPRQNKIPRPGTVRLIYGKPMQLHHLSGQEIVEAMTTRFNELFAEATAWRNEALK